MVSKKETKEDKGRKQESKKEKDSKKEGKIARNQETKEVKNG